MIMHFSHFVGVGHHVAMTRGRGMQVYAMMKGLREWIHDSTSMLMTDVGDDTRRWIFRN